MPKQGPDVVRDTEHQFSQLRAAEKQAGGRTFNRLLSYLAYCQSDRKEKHEVELLYTEQEKKKGKLLAILYMTEKKVGSSLDT